MYLKKQLLDSCLHWDTAAQIRELLFLAQSHRVHFPLLSTCACLHFSAKDLSRESELHPFVVSSIATLDRTETLPLIYLVKECLS